MLRNNPLISVVTVSYNAVSTIEQTILSVINQTYSDIEYIIIDGGSTDGTVDVIKKYADRISYWVSEPDNGVYAAMNKGAKVASGEWINYMNAGDSFARDNVLCALFDTNLSEDIGIVFGNTIFVRGNNRKVMRYGVDPHHKVMPSCHQSIFCKRSLLLKYPFDLTFKIAADYNFFYQLYKANVQRKYVNIIVSVYDAMNGISSRHEWIARKEMLKIENGSCIYYVKSLFLYIKLTIKKFLIFLKIK